VRAGRPRWTCLLPSKPALGNAAAQRRDAIVQLQPASERQRTHHINGPLAVAVAHVRPRAGLQQHASGAQPAAARCPMERRVADVVSTMQIRARSHQRVDGGCVAVNCGPHERCVAIAGRAIHACTRLHQRSDRSNVAVARSVLQRRPTARSLERVGIRARRDLPLDLGDVTEIRSVTQPQIRLARHGLPAHTPRHAGSMPLVAQRSSDRAVACRTRGRGGGSRAIASKGAAAHGWRRGDKSPSAPGATRGGQPWAARARRRAGHTIGGGPGPARNQGGEIGTQSHAPAPRSPRCTRQPGVVLTFCVRTSGWARRRCAGGAGVARGAVARWCGGVVVRVLAGDWRKWGC
jgi:hypothetical protein